MENEISKMQERAAAIKLGGGEAALKKQNDLG